MNYQHKELAVGFSRLKEFARLREVIVDYFYGTNQFLSTLEFLQRYFLSFTYDAARRNH